MSATGTDPVRGIDPDERLHGLPGHEAGSPVEDRLMLTFGTGGVVEVSRREGETWSSSGSHQVAGGGPVAVPEDLRALMGPIRRAA